MPHSPYTLPPEKKAVNHILGTGADLNDKLQVFKGLSPRPQADYSHALTAIKGDHEVTIAPAGRFKIKWHESPSELTAALEALSAEGKAPRLIILGPSTPSDAQAKLETIEIPHISLSRLLHYTDIKDRVKQGLRQPSPHALIIKGDTAEIQPATARIGQSIQSHGFKAQTFNHMRDWAASKPLSMRTPPRCILLAYDSGKGAERIEQLRAHNTTLPPIILYNDSPHDHQPIPKEMQDTAQKYGVPLIDPCYTHPKRLDSHLSHALKEAGILPAKNCGYNR